MFCIDFIYTNPKHQVVLAKQIIPNVKHNFLWINFINAHTSQTEFQLQTLETLQPLMKQDETPSKHYSANAYMYIYIYV